MTNIKEELKELAEFSLFFSLCKRHKTKLERVMAIKSVQFANCAFSDVIRKFDDPNFKENIELFSKRYHISKPAVLETYFMGYMLQYILTHAKINYKDENMKLN